PLVDREQHVARDRRSGAEAAAVQQPHIVAVAVEQPFVRVTQQPVQRARFRDFVLERGSFRVDRLDRLLQQRRRVHVRHLLGIPALGVVEVRGARGDPKQVLLRLEVEETEPLFVGRPDELAGRGIAPHPDAVRRLDQDRRPRADLLDDLGVDGPIAGVSAGRVAGVDVDHRGAGRVAARCRFADLGGLLRDHGAVAVLPHAAVQRDGADALVAGEHCAPPPIPRYGGRLALRTRCDGPLSRGRARGSIAWSALQNRSRSQGGDVATIQQIDEWRAPTKIGASYEKLLAAIGTQEFGATVRDQVLSMTAGARRVYLFEATSRESTTLQYSFCEPAVADLSPTYTRWYLRSDPLGDAFDAAPRPHDVARLRGRPADTATPSSRRPFFPDAGIVERISVIQRGRDAWRGINIARHSSDGRCSDEELRSLIGLACLVLPMLPLNRQRGTAAAPLPIAELEKRFGDRCARL